MTPERVRAMALLKSLVVRAGDSAGLFRAGHALARLRHGAGYIRAINYHGTPAADAAGLADQLDFFRRHFANAGPDELASCLAGRWQAQKPGILISFDDAYRSNYEVAAPLLESHGFRGWFFVPVGRLADSNDRRMADAEGREFMTWHEAKELCARGHVVGCHTDNHVRLSDRLPPEELEAEIVSARPRLAAGLGAPVDSFCWVGGEEWSYGREAARRIEKAGYRWAFMTNCALTTAATHPHWIDRTNVEASWPLSQVRFYLSGVVDLAYAGKRRRLAKKLARPAPLAPPRRRVHAMGKL